MRTAIIMAAGFGSRLMPITKNVPKTMVKVNGEMMIENILEQLAENKFDRIIVVTGYLTEKLEDYLRVTHPTVEIVVNKDYETTNNLYSFLMASKDVEGDVLFMNSDLYFDKKFISEVLENDESVIAVRKGEWNDENMKVTVTDGNLANGISKSFGAHESYAVSCDTYFFKKERFEKFLKVAELIQEKDRNAWTEVAIHEMIKNDPINVVDTIEFDWFEIDNLEDLEDASIMFSKNNGIFEDYDTYIYDLDGTLYTDGTAIKGASEIVNGQIEDGISVYVITNNSAKTTNEYCQKLNDIGFKVTNDMVINSSIPSIKYIEKNKLYPTYIYGTNSLKSLATKRFVITDNPMEAKSFLIGNNQNFDYKRLTELLVGIQNNKSANILATNPDILYPLGDNNYTVDTGTTINIIKTITDRPIKVIGKPNAGIIEDFIKGKTILFGDRIYTDMQCASNANIDSCLVMTGESNIIDYEGSDLKITKIIKSIK